MEKQTNKIASVLNFVGGLSGVLALGTLIFYGGAMAEQVRALNTRVAALENSGSPSAQSHVVMDAERDRALADRITKLENALLTVPSELSRINAKLDLMKERLDRVP